MPSKHNAHNANGHRRRQLVARVKARDTHCALCHEPLNPTAPNLDPRQTVVDEDIPRSRGGNPLDPANTNGMHRACNRWKSTMTLAEAHAAIAAGARISQPITRAQRRALLTPTVGQWEAGAGRWT